VISILNLIFVCFRDVTEYVGIPDVPVAALLQVHVSSRILFKSARMVIRRSRPWKSFLKEMQEQNVDDSVDFEVCIILGHITTTNV